MKKRDIILDFTSLLDVTLILLFFFVLFSHLDNEENRVRTDNKIREMEMSIAEADIREKEAERLSTKLEDEIRLVTEASERNGSNVSELLSYNRDQNLKILMDMGDGGYSLRVLADGEVASNISGKENMAEDLKRMIEEAGYDAGDTILCDYIFDGSKAGSRQAYIAVTEGLNELSEQYRYLYISETDLSAGEEKN
ncbi:MAG: hypothetical protein K6G22_02780 [Lachnospiraceae bacterium]|nr:hypothetical protein [Lachnospiraceae bacterium]